MSVLKLRVTFSILMSPRCHQVAEILKSVSPSAMPAVANGMQRSPSDRAVLFTESRFGGPAVGRVAAVLVGDAGGGFISETVAVTDTGEAHRLIAVHTEEMPVALHHVVVDAHDLRGLARFWSQALGWAVLSVREREIVIGPDDHASVGMCFMPVTDVKTLKNRVHLDLTTSAEDRDAEIERLLGLGAQRVDVGQTGAESWTVLADPEGNEFCVVRPKRTLTS